MSFLYLTADAIGAQTGGGAVTFNELLAMTEIGNGITTIGREELGDCRDPWGWDEKASTMRDWFVNPPKLAHVYSGTFSKTVASLKRNGCKVAYTIAAHDRRISREEHEKLGLPFPYTHLTDERLWQRYIEGYRLADVIICPGKHAADVVRNYGPEFKDKRIEIVPHGCHIPKGIKPPPKNFTVGYMGSIGADKGVIYLLRAMRDQGCLLKIAGKDSTHQFMQHLLNLSGGSGNVWLCGWQENVSDFYDSISLYVQPSATEGFGLEVIEAMAHGRPVLCSENAGAADLVPKWLRFKARDHEALANKIKMVKLQEVNFKEPDYWQSIAEQYTWDTIRNRYKAIWRSLL